MNIIDELSHKISGLSPSERRIANIILADPEEAMQMSMAKLAAAAEVSDPTVNRFSKGMGFEGYTAFKLQLAKSLAEKTLRGAPFVHSAVSQEDDVDTCTNKIFASARQALSSASQNLDMATIEKAVDLLAGASAIHFLGLGGSASVTNDAHHKFFRLGAPVSAHHDILMQRMVCSGSSPDEVAVFISNTGQTSALLECAEILNEIGCPSISITSPNSALAKLTTLSIGIKSYEDAELYMPSTTRIVQLLVVDALAANLALRRGPEFSEHLAKVKSSLQATRIKT